MRECPSGLVTGVDVRAMDFGLPPEIDIELDGDMESLAKGLLRSRRLPPGFVDMASRCAML